jgi:hypothetical protein
MPYSTASNQPVTIHHIGDSASLFEILAGAIEQPRHKDAKGKGNWRPHAKSSLKVRSSS